MTLLREIREALVDTPVDDLVPELRRGQVGRVEAVAKVLPMGSQSALALADLDDGRALIVPMVSAGGAWRRAQAEDAISRDVLTAAGPLETFTLDSEALTSITSPHRERCLDVDMSNDVRVIDDRIVVKWRLFAEPGSSQGPRLVEHLSANGFDEMPAPLASVTWDDSVIATFTEYLPNAQDGWDWMVTDLVAFLQGDAPAPGWPRACGALIARMHRAAAQPSALFSHPTTRARDLAPLARHYEHLFAVDLDEEMAAALAPWTDRFLTAIDTLGSARDVEVIPVHGDVHAGQFLRSSGGLALNDFDGNPLLPPAHRWDPAPSGYDIAGLTRSLDHVAIVAARRVGGERDLVTAREWSQDARREVLTGYSSVAEAPNLDEGILMALEDLSPLHEAVYASRYLPRWRYVPLSVLRNGW